MRHIEARGLVSYTETVIQTELEESFWTTLLPQAMETSSAASPYFIVYQAAQTKLHDRGFLSRDITVHGLLINDDPVDPFQYGDLCPHLGQPGVDLDLGLVEARIVVCRGLSGSLVFCSDAPASLRAP